jgi:hypothetical protein
MSASEAFHAYVAVNDPSPLELSGHDTTFPSPAGWAGSQTEEILQCSVAFPEMAD